MPSCGHGSGTLGGQRDLSSGQPVSVGCVHDAAGSAASPDANCTTSAAASDGARWQVATQRSARHMLSTTSRSPGCQLTRSARPSSLVSKRTPPRAGNALTSAMTHDCAPKASAKAFGFRKTALERGSAVSARRAENARGRAYVRTMSASTLILAPAPDPRPGPHPNAAPTANSTPPSSVRCSGPGAPTSSPPNPHPRSAERASRY